MNATLGLLDRDHPSFGTSNATFLFALQDDRGGVVRFLVVEAKNPYAVATIERILVQNDQQVAPNCRVLAAFRDARNTGVRDDLVEEVSYVDFITDIVEASWLLADPVNTTCLSQSITAEEKQYIQQKAQMLAGTRSAPRLVAAPEPEETEEEEQDEPEPNTNQRIQLSAALTGMGFKKAAVDKFVRDLGSRADRAPLQDLLREGLRALAS